jgi:general secretion pathway protein K
MPTSTATGTRADRGGALLAVLWVSAALAAISLSVAMTVRGEIDRSSSLAEGVRAQYLAQGGVERAIAYTQWGPGQRNPDGTPKYFEPGMPRLLLNFPGGLAQVDIIPEIAKLDANFTPPGDLVRLLLNLGAEFPRAEEVAAAIVDWRTAAPAGVTQFDAFYMGLQPSFRARHASIIEIEELLLVKGMTPELFYGSAGRTPDGRLEIRAGLRDCLSVFGSTGAVDVNGAALPVLLTVGLSPDAALAIVERRRVQPFRRMEEVAAFLGPGVPGVNRLTIGGGTIFTFRSTARVRRQDGGLSDLSRTVSATLKYHQERTEGPAIETLRWYAY